MGGGEEEVGKLGKFTSIVFYELYFTPGVYRLDSFRLGAYF